MQKIFAMSLFNFNICDRIFIVFYINPIIIFLTPTKELFRSCKKIEFNCHSIVDSIRLTFSFPHLLLQYLRIFWHQDFILLDCLGTKPEKIIVISHTSVSLSVCRLDCLLSLMSVEEKKSSSHNGRAINKGRGGE